MYKTTSSERHFSKPKQRGNTRKDFYAFNHTIGEQELRHDLQHLQGRALGKQKNIEKKFEQYYRVYELTPYKRSQPCRPKTKGPKDGARADWRSLKRKTSNSALEEKEATGDEVERASKMGEETK